MRVLTGLGIFLLVLGGIAMAGGNKMGIHEVSHVTFQTQVHIGTNVLPAGKYIVRHTMEGQDHIMVFQRENGKKEEFKAKCTLVPLGKNAPRDEASYQVIAGNERVLQELVFQGDSSKHVF